MRYIIPDKLYDILKWVAWLAVPSLATLLGTVGSVWGWPHTTAIVTTVTAIGVFIGGLIGVSAATGKPNQQIEPSRENG